MGGRVEEVDVYRRWLTFLALLNRRDAFLKLDGVTSKCVCNLQV